MSQETLTAIMGTTPASSLESMPTPRQILATLLPHLKVAAAYAHQIQSRIAARPSKEAEHLFAAALSDADLSIQTLVEVALLGTFPELRFYGEEYAQSHNTKYFRGTDLQPEEYLITLDPVDGTRYYLDGHSNYQVILGILGWEEYEAAIALTPAQNHYYFALRGQGCWQGTLEDGLEDCQPLRVGETQPVILLGWKMADVVPLLSDRYQVLDVRTAYSQEVQIPNFNGMLNGELAGAISRVGQFIDGAALAFLAQEAGCLVTDFAGNPPPPLHTCQNYQRGGLLVAASPEVHQDLLAAVQALPIA